MGNEMTAELLAKFNALQLQADNEANKKVKNRNGKVDADNKKEIKIFQDLVTKQFREGKINDTDYATLMGASFTTQTTATTEATVEKKEEKKETETSNKTEQKEITKDIKRYIDEKPSITLANLVEELKKDNQNPVYTTVINEVNEVVKFAQEEKFNSKDEVKALEDKIKDNKNFNEFQQDLANNIVKLAKREQIYKETEVLTEIYDLVVKAEKEGSEVNYTERLNKVKAQMKEQKLTDKSYYSDEAFEAVEAKVAEEIRTWAKRELINLEYNKVSAEKKKDVLKLILNKLPETDKFAKTVIEKMEDFASVETNRMNRERRREELKAISKSEIEKGLKKETYSLLKRNFLSEESKNYNKEKKTYDLSILSDAIRIVVGADEEMNTYGDYKRSEVQEAVTTLKTLLERGDLEEKHMKDLKDFCRIPDAPRSREAKEVFSNVRDEAIAGATIAAALAPAKITNIAIAEVTGIASSVAKQVIKFAPMAAAAIPVEIGLDALIKAIIGVKKDEETCFIYEDAKGKSIQEYIKHLELTAESEEQANAIAVLAKAYEAKYKENWNTKFIDDMKEAAGNDPVLNCKEFRSAYPRLFDKLELEPIAEEKPPVTPTVKEENVKITTTENVTHTWKAGQSWQAMVLAHYPEAFNGMTYDQIKAKIKPFVDAFRRSQGIGFRQGLPVNQTVAFKEITVNGITYKPVQADEETIKKCTSNEWFGYKSSYFTDNWNIKTEGNAKVNGQKVYTSTRNSDNATNTGNNEKATQDALIPEAEENTKITVEITSVDGSKRQEIVNPLKKENKE